MNWSPREGTSVYNWLLRLGATREDLYDMSLHSMCDYGAKEFRAGRTDCIRFDLFNTNEAAIVNAYMADKHPGVEFFCTWFAASSANDGDEKHD
jgi:hypothetical protein